ncbi:hypothetical protein QFC21_002863 [Naganishia friedmannii]|uniref:Uncharacterized protein n=1 Tax=Naganishia friedmannii TaxID=89922 RepID=A0ACC2VTF0_9TREE|nr:hypothetical protein QFC21_002863 [Naganishia friedmannii]
MSSRGRSPSPRSITSSARAKKESDQAELDTRKDRSVSRGRDGKDVTKSHSRSRSRGRSRSKSNASMRSRSRSRSASRSPARSRNRSIPPPRIPNDSKDTQAAGRGPAWRVVIVSGLTKNVRREHLEEIFGKYGRITGVDLPIFVKYVDRTMATEEDQVGERDLRPGIMTTGMEIGMDRGSDESETMRMALLAVDKGTLIKVVPELLVDVRVTEETGTILGTGTAETVEELALMTDDDARILALALHQLVVVCPHEADKIPDHPFVDPVAAAVPSLGPRAEADQYDRTRHTRDLLRGPGPGRVLRDQSLAPDRIHEVSGEGATLEVQSGSPKTKVEAPVLESRISLVTDSSSKAQPHWLFTGGNIHQRRTTYFTIAQQQFQNFSDVSCSA